MTSRQTTVADDEPAGQLAAMIADLNGYVDRRAHDVAVPLVAQAERDAMARVLDLQAQLAVARADVQRWQDVTTELRRRITSLQWIADEAREARVTLARALGHHPLGLMLPNLVAEAVQRLTAEGKPDA